MGVGSSLHKKSPFKNVKSQPGAAKSSSDIKIAEQGEGSVKPKIKKKEDKPTNEQLDRWISSIDLLLEDIDGVNAFRQFLIEIEEAENAKHRPYTRYLDFYAECTHFNEKLIEIEKKAENIYEKYVKPGSPFEIGGIDDEGDKISAKLKPEGDEEVKFKKSLCIFDEIQEKAKDKLNTKHYSMFKEYLQEKYS